MSMKNQEIFLAAAVIAAVAGVGASLAARAFVDAPGRETEPRAAAREPAPDSAREAGAAEEARRALDDLRMENSALAERIAALEARLAEVASTRTPLAAEPGPVASDGELSGSIAELAAAQGVAVTPEFVASVGQALETIRAREEAEREQRRKELQAQRIEDRLAKLQQELGLSNRQVSDMRTVLAAQDDKRETLFASMRDSMGDPRGDPGQAREGFRAIRDETIASLQTILTPEQLEGYKRSEDSDFGRREFRRGPEGVGPGRDGDSGRPGR
jgi:hypothetical protein